MYVYAITHKKSGRLVALYETEALAKADLPCLRKPHKYEITECYLSTANEKED